MNAINVGIQQVAEGGALPTVCWTDTGSVTWAMTDLLMVNPAIRLPTFREAYIMMMVRYNDMICFVCRCLTTSVKCTNINTCSEQCLDMMH